MEQTNKLIFFMLFVLASCNTSISQDSISYKSIGWFVDNSFLKDSFSELSYSPSVGIIYKRNLSSRNAITLRSSINYRQTSNNFYFIKVKKLPSNNGNYFVRPDPNGSNGEHNAMIRHKQLSLGLSINYRFRPFLKIPIEIGFGTGAQIKLIDFTNGKGVLTLVNIPDQDESNFHFDENLVPDRITKVPVLIHLNWVLTDSEISLGISSYKIGYDPGFVKHNKFIYNIGYARIINSYLKKNVDTFKDPNAKLKMDLNY